jgi:hypothetical protein
MSEWRRLAIVALPCCKKTIDAADNVNVLWIMLKDELSSACKEPQVDKAKIQQIYSFAIQCLRGSGSSHLNSSVWLFFEYVIGGGGRRLEELANHMSSGEFTRLLEDYRGTFSDEKLSSVSRIFHESLHKRP